MASLNNISVTAQPTHISEQVGSVTPAEPGLSVDTEDIGRQFRSSAVEQGHADSHELSDADFSLEDADDATALADALELDASAGSLRSWERALVRSLAHGRQPGSVTGPGDGSLARPGESSSAPMKNEQGPRPARTHRQALGPSHLWDEVDLTDEAIYEASLLDHEGPELGQVEEPSLLRTDDTRTHGKPRGGHFPARSKRGPRASRT